MVTLSQHSNGLEFDEEVAYEETVEISEENAFLLMILALITFMGFCIVYYRRKITQGRTI